MSGIAIERSRFSRLTSLLLRARWRGAAFWLTCLVNAIGLALRVEHALTFDNLKRGADYERHMGGVDWMMHHWRPFDFTPDISWTVSYHPPLWHALGALLKLLFHANRSLVSMAVAGWVLRQFLLSRLLSRAVPHQKWVQLIVLTFGAFLPISVETDGTINPETLHTALFTLAVFWFWKMEQDARLPSGVRSSTALCFGGFAGLAVLTKATSGLLPIAAVLLLAWQLFDAYGRGTSIRVSWQRLIRPNLLAGLAWVIVAGWFCVPNLVKYHHPFPHAWDMDPHLLDDIPEYKFPIFYRRPLGWALPFEWHPWLEEPMQQSYLAPRPNAWAQFVTGTWSDIINRGFCRLSGGGATTKFFDGWPVSGRCIEVMSIVAHVGLFMTIVVLFFLLRCARNSLRSHGRRGTLTLPIVAMLGFGFTFLFTLTYPVDGMVATNARYLLPISMPLLASLGIGLSELKGRWVGRVLVPVLGLMAAIVAVLVTYERWGS